MDFLKLLLRYAIAIVVILFLGYLLSFCDIKDSDYSYSGRAGWADM